MLSTFVRPLTDETVTNSTDVEFGIEGETSPEYSNAIDSHEEQSLAHDDEIIGHGEASNEATSYSGVVLGPLACATKIGFKALSMTTTVGSYACVGTSYAVAGLSYLPYQLARTLERNREEVEDSVSYRVTTFSCNLLYCTSSTIYATSYIPYTTGKVLSQISCLSAKADSFLTPERVEQACAKVDSCILTTQQNCSTWVQGLSSVLHGTHIESFTNHAIASLPVA